MYKAPPLSSILGQSSGSVPVQSRFSWSRSCCLHLFLQLSPPGVLWSLVLSFPGGSISELALLSPHRLFVVYGPSLLPTFLFLILLPITLISVLLHSLKLVMVLGQNIFSILNRHLFTKNLKFRFQIFVTNNKNTLYHRVTAEIGFANSSILNVFLGFNKKRTQ